MSMNCVKSKRLEVAESLPAGSGEDWLCAQGWAVRK